MNDSNDFNIRKMIQLILSAWRWLLVGVLVGGAIGVVPLLRPSTAESQPLYQSYALIYLDPEINPYTSGHLPTLVQNDMIMSELKDRFPAEFDLVTNFNPAVNEKNSPGTLSLVVSSTDMAVPQPIANAWAEIVIQWLRDSINSNGSVDQALAISREADAALYQFLGDHGLTALAYCDVTYLVGVDPCPSTNPSDMAAGLHLTPEVRAELSQLVAKSMFARQSAQSISSENTHSISKLNSGLFLYSAAATPFLSEGITNQPDLSPIFPLVGVIAGVLIALCVVLFLDWWKSGK